MNTQMLAGAAALVLIGVGGGWLLGQQHGLSTSPAPILDPATQAQVAATGPMPGHNPNAEVSSTVAGGHGPAQGMLGGVDLTNPAAVDTAFIAGMIPHHEAAVADAKLVIEHGEDADVKGLAETIIKSQQSEIEWMRGWASRHGVHHGANAGQNTATGGSDGEGDDQGSGDDNDVE